MYPTIRKIYEYFIENFDINSKIKVDNLRGKIIVDNLNCAYYLYFNGVKLLHDKLGEHFDSEKDDKFISAFDEDIEEYLKNELSSTTLLSLSITDIYLYDQNTSLVVVDGINKICIRVCFFEKKQVVCKIQISAIILNKIEENDFIFPSFEVTKNNFVLETWKNTILFDFTNSDSLEFYFVNLKNGDKYKLYNNGLFKLSKYDTFLLQYNVLFVFSVLIYDQFKSTKYLPDGLIYESHENNIYVLE